MKILFLFFWTMKIWAAPTHIEVWFVSATKKAELIKQINQQATPLYFSMTAQNEQLSCEPFGEYCFDPQIGLYKKEESGAPKFDVPIHLQEEALPQLPVAKSVDRSIISCDKTFAFDMFCGEAKPTSVPTKSKFELWIDTSSSMKEMDFSDNSGMCFRSRMVQKLDNVCKFQKDVNVMMFDTSIKQAGTIESLCINSGLNDYKKLLDWIERSDATTLVVVTDIYEFYREVSDYVELHKGRIRGDKDPMVASDLDGMVDNLAKLCH